MRRLDFPFGTFLAALGLEHPPLKKFQAMPGVAWARAAGSRPILAAREQNPQGSRVPLGRVAVGGEALALVAGPCSVEDREQILTTARFVAAYGATALRGGAYKPRTSPYAFQGLGQAGVELLQEAGLEAGLPVVTEVMDPGDVEAMAPFVDCFQVGARNMSNGPLLRAVGRAGKPVLLKRGPSATLAEFVLAAEYVLLEGNAQVILCERGIRTFETATRNTLDLNAIPVLKGMTHLPVLVDPSHGTGRARRGDTHGPGRGGRRRRRHRGGSAPRPLPGPLRRRPVPALPRIPPAGRGAAARWPRRWAGGWTCPKPCLTPPTRSRSSGGPWAGADPTDPEPTMTLSLRSLPRALPAGGPRLHGGLPGPRLGPRRRWAPPCWR